MEFPSYKSIKAGCIGLALGFNALLPLGASGAQETFNQPLPPANTAGRDQPNIVMIMADDLGWGDLSCYGSQAIDTPNLDALAEEGMMMTDFYSSNALCTPSRTGFLTGRYPQRVGMNWVLWQEDLPLSQKMLRKVAPALRNVGGSDVGADCDVRGLPEDEITVGEALQNAGYYTGHVGKWHQGDFRYLPEYNPLNHGFDWFHGLPWDQEESPCPLYVNYDEVKSSWESLSDIHGNLADAAEAFVRDAAEQDNPFFLYYAPPDPHIPLLPSPEFEGRSDAGVYGDVVEELDANVGQLLRALEETGEADNTVVVFTSDNGAWFHGSTGGQRGRKGQSYEGGFNVPMIVRWPGKIQPGSVSSTPAVNLDLMPTFVAMAGGTMPQDRIIDGQDLTPLFQGEEFDHNPIYFYHHDELEGVREDQWKYYTDISTYVYPVPIDKNFAPTIEQPWLYDLTQDPSESYPLTSKYPEVAERLENLITNFDEAMKKNPKGAL